MILENGYVSFFSGGEEPAIVHGVPQPVSGGSWSELIPCQWRVLNRNYQAVSAATAQAETRASYEILISNEELWSERVRLYDADNSQVGEYPVISMEHLHILNIRRLIV